MSTIKLASFIEIKDKFIVKNNLPSGNMTVNG